MSVYIQAPGNPMIPAERLDHILNHSQERLTHLALALPWYNHQCLPLDWCYTF